jgi:hypothetical protein
MRARNLTWLYRRKFDVCMRYAWDCLPSQDRLGGEVEHSMDIVSVIVVLCNVMF